MYVYFFSHFDTSYHFSWHAVSTFRFCNKTFNTRFCRELIKIKEYVCCSFSYLFGDFPISIIVGSNRFESVVFSFLFTHCVKNIILVGRWAIENWVCKYELVFQFSGDFIEITDIYEINDQTLPIMVALHLFSIHCGGRT